MGNAVTTEDGGVQLEEPVTVKDTDVGEITVPPAKHVTNGIKKKNPVGNDSSSSSNGSRMNEAKSIRYAATSMQGWRPTNEDHHLLSPSITIPSSSADGGGAPVTFHNHALFAVFDGHGGGFTSDYAGNNLLRVLGARREWVEYLALSEKDRSDVPGIELLKAALVGAFLDLDTELYDIHIDKVQMEGGEAGIAVETREEAEPKRAEASKRQQEQVPAKVSNTDPTESQEEVGVEVSATSAPSSPMMKADRSGSTAVAVLLTPSHIICANAGDSRSILVRSGVAYPMSFDHKPSTPCEHSRIVNAMGTVRMKRVDGDLAVSRGLGDFRFKGNVDLKVEHQKVSARPDLLVNPRDDNVDEFIVLACDGIWDVMGNQDCADAVQTLLDDGETDLGLLCEEILDTCLEKDSRDNMTVCMVALPACKIMSKENVAKSGKRGVVKRREIREKSGVTPGQSRRARKVAKAAAAAAEKAKEASETRQVEMKKVKQNSAQAAPD